MESTDFLLEKKIEYLVDMKVGKLKIIINQQVCKLCFCKIMNWRKVYAITTFSRIF